MLSTTLSLLLAIPTLAPPPAPRQDQDVRIIGRTLTLSDGTGGTYRVETGADGRLSITRGGVVLSAERVRVDGEDVTILDERGGAVVRIAKTDDGRIELRATSPARRAQMGVHLGEVPEALAAQLGVEAAKSSVVTGLDDGGPAEVAGVRLHDVITGIGGGAASVDAIRECLAGCSPGDEVALELMRRGEARTMRVCLGEASLVATLRDDGLSGAWRRLNANTATDEVLTALGSAAAARTVSEPLLLQALTQAAVAKAKEAAREAAKESAKTKSSVPYLAEVPTIGFLFEDGRWSTSRRSPAKNEFQEDDSRLGEIAARLSKLEERIEEILRRLDADATPRRESR